MKRQGTVFTDEGKELPAERKPSRGVLQFSFICVGAWLLMREAKVLPSSDFSFDFAGETKSN